MNQISEGENNISLKYTFATVKKALKVILIALAIAGVSSVYKVNQLNKIISDKTIAYNKSVDIRTRIEMDIAELERIKTDMFKNTLKQPIDDRMNQGIDKARD